MHSCIYHGRTRHARQTPHQHRFQYPLYMLYVDLDEWQTISQRVPALTRRLSIARLLRSDHFGDVDQPLDESVRDLCEERTGERPAGPIRMLTQLRCWGIYFSPINLFYCFDSDGSTLVMVVAEVSNTPWNERHCYVLWDGNRIETRDRRFRFRNSKAFHVSPFMDMRLQYDWHLTPPSDHLGVLIRNRRDGHTFFDAQLTMKRRELTGASLAKTLLRHPCQPVSITLAIYYQAFRLWMKRCPLYNHSSNQPTSKLSTPATQSSAVN